METIAIIHPSLALATDIEIYFSRQGYLTAHCRSILELIEARNRRPVLLTIVMHTNQLEPALEIMDQCHQLDPEMGVIFLGQDLDLTTVLELMRKGANDYAAAFESLDRLETWIEVNIARSRSRKTSLSIEKEKLCRELEETQLVSWRNLYATKEAVQAEELMKRLDTMLGSSGDYQWFKEMVDATVLEDDSPQVTMPREIYQNVVRALVSQKNTYEFIHYLNSLDTLAITKTEHRVQDFQGTCEQMLTQTMVDLCRTYDRQYKTSFTETIPIDNGFVCQDPDILEQCLGELVINAIKYSPDMSPLVAGIDAELDARLPVLNIWLRNQPKLGSGTKKTGERIEGMPYEYSERVFDLFYQIDSGVEEFPEEVWPGGSGLYITRKLFKRQGAWLSVSNGVDYTGFRAEPFVKFNVSIPIHTKREASRCNPKCSPCPFLRIQR